MVELQAQAQLLKKQGLSNRQIAAKLGVCKETIRNYTNPEAKAKAMEYCHTDSYREKRRQYQSLPQQRKAARERQASKRQVDLQFRLTGNLRSRLTQALKINQKTGSAIQDLGCSIEFLKQHLASQFQEGMSWQNYGEWHIDHKKPLAAFDLSDREQIIQACHYTNLQPMWAVDNIRKSDSHA